jgi:hypothetical protein
MTTSKFGFGSIIAAVVLSAAATQTHANTTYDATTDFSLVSNPNGVWSYGYSHLTAPSYAFTPFNSVSGTLWEDSSYNTLSTPSVFLNNTGGIVNGVAPGQISLNPGPVPNGDFAIVRFTAPTAGTYDVNGQFYAGDVGAMNGYIVLAGNLGTPLETFVNTTNSSIFTPLSLPMTSGETLDFVVGNGGGSFYSGDTPLTATITAVPLPTTAWLLLSGLVGTGLLVRKRRGGAMVLRVAA